jgi:hypothetical protein
LWGVRLGFEAAHGRGLREVAVLDVGRITALFARYTKDNPIELDRNWELVMINALRDVFPCADATRG